MKLSTAAFAFFVASTATSASADDTKKYRATRPGRIEISTLDMDFVLSQHHGIQDASTSTAAYRASTDGTRGHSLIHTELKQTLKSAAGFFPEPPTTSSEEEWHSVLTTYLRSTSNYHIDHKANRGPMGDCDTVVADGMVGFVALETNKNAYFDHQDMSVPIQAGTFVRFMGNSPHRTVVNKGHVHLLGPFELKSFVGVTCPCPPTSPPTSPPTNPPSQPPTPPIGTSTSTSGSSSSSADEGRVRRLRAI